jgi:hypothetical protein
LLNNSHGISPQGFLSKISSIAEDYGIACCHFLPQIMLKIEGKELISEAH